MILLGLLDILVTVSDLVSFLVFSLLVTVRFGLSQQVLRCDGLSCNDTRKVSRVE